VVRLAVGAPVFAPVLAVAPIAPDPFVPVVSTPVKLITVIVDVGAVCEKFAVTVALDNGEAANARQTSEVPPWALLRTTNVHGSPPPVTLETVMFDESASLEMNASNSSFPLAVEKAELVMAEPLAVTSLEVFASIVMLVTATVCPVKLIPVTFALLMVAL
jgi:hypothetical protein